MSGASASTLTVAKLKALCVLNDLPTSGRKADLVERLLEAGVDRQTLGLEVIDSVGKEVAKAASTREPAAVDSTNDDGELMFSLEDDDTLTPLAAEAVDDSKDTHSGVDVHQESPEEEVLEAELFLDESPIEPLASSKPPVSSSVELPKAESSVPVPVLSKTASPTTLADMIRRPQFVAIALTVLVLGAGGWYYLNNQLEPFTADSLRYGDTMGYTVTEGEFMASEEYVELVTEQFEDLSDYCKIRLLFAGTGSVSITEGTSGDLISQPTEDRLGAVSARGGQGMSWLTVETVNAMSLSTFNIYGHNSAPSIGGGTYCPDFAEGTEGRADLTVTRWNELREQATLATHVDAYLQNTQGTYEAEAMTYGVGGLLGGLEDLSPGLGMVLQPVELANFFGDTYITDDASGTSSGWAWRVIGAEMLGNTEVWKVTASHRDIQDFCLGYATMNLWLEADSPWVVRQTVDVSISSNEANQNSCSGWLERGVEAVLPEGELELHHTFERTSNSRGVKSIELGMAYNNRPQANDLNPDEDELANWGPNGLHLPDNSTLRTHPLDQAVDCIDGFGSAASAANAALDDGGYIWRAQNNMNGSTTEWNISWVATDSSAGWLLFGVSGGDENVDCEYLGRGAYDESVTHNRDSIPDALPLHSMVERLKATQRFPHLTGDEALFNSGGLHDTTRVGYLVVVPGSGLGFDLSDLFDSVTGATTVDVQRSWDDSTWSNTFSLLADGTDGRVLGWTHTKQAR